MVSKFTSGAETTVTLVVENNHLHQLKFQATRTCALKMFGMSSCLTAHVINFFLIDIVNAVQA